MLDLFVFCLLAASLFCQTKLASVEENENDEYFGVPLGAFHSSSDGTSAEVYAADEFTIIFNHFYHSPQNPDCMAMMIGPARKDDIKNVVEGHGLLLFQAHPPVAARYHRAKRQTNTDFMEQFDSWPIEFDHLLMAEPTVVNQTIDGETSSKIHIHRLNKFTSNFSRTTTSAIIKLQKNTATVFHENKQNLTYTTIKPNTVFNKKFTLSKITKNSLGTITTPSTTLAYTKETSIAAQFNNKNVIKVADVKPLILFGYKRGSKQKVSKLSLINKAQDSQMLVTTSSKTISFAPDLRHNNNIVSKKSNSKIEFGQEALAKSKKKDLDKATAVLHTTTPLYYVIKDPREPRRRRLLELRRNLSSANKITKTTVTSKLKFDFDSRFKLPALSDKLITFTLTNGAKINQYKWIGVYDQCLKRHISLVSLNDIDPPKEEKITPLSGWSHNITSYRVHILNCNTLLIPGFTYDNRNATSNTYFYAGIGKFPENIERQIKATVVGSDRNEPLKTLNGENILLRLPKGYRTFDIDFISVYNRDEKKIYAHVNIPSLLVPPCTED